MAARLIEFEIEANPAPRLDKALGRDVPEEHLLVTAAGSTPRDQRAQRPAQELQPLSGRRDTSCLPVDQAP